MTWLPQKKKNTKDSDLESCNLPFGSVDGVAINTDLNINYLFVAFADFLSLCSVGVLFRLRGFLKLLPIACTVSNEYQPVNVSKLKTSNTRLSKKRETSKRKLFTAVIASRIGGLQTKDIGLHRNYLFVARTQLFSYFSCRLFSRTFGIFF